ncbi:MAG: hypothetical protein PHW25_14920 [Zoogloea sp.]|uniref:hypothetical protein n=1 Tax=Zoogloea sp. TaxID=49181 RepID=UPI0026310101|nr:hypothetical protein [Zoogloea sp.]MDD3328373.1 hypothetical protein [Zoogloea sp.]
MMRRWLATAGLLLCCSEAMALKFKPMTDSEGRPVLAVYDCARITEERKAGCQDHENSFTGPGKGYKGDAAVLEAMLRERGYYQVWLYSGGGNLDEGIRMGRVLRQHRQFTYVPKGFICVSACTVAFLGGVLRDVAPGGAYEVHAYSGVKNWPPERLQRFVSAEGDVSLKNFVTESSDDGMIYAGRLFLYAQQMIGGQPDEERTIEVLANSPDYAKDYLGSPRFRSDFAQMKAEGVGRAHETLMRIERESFETRLAHLKAHADRLGERSAKAVRMLEIMFSSRIDGTAELDQNTLRQNGYINVRR